MESIGRVKVTNLSQSVTVHDSTFLGKFHYERDMEECVKKTILVVHKSVITDVLTIIPTTITAVFFT
jgi:hypothetical protein